jgi:phosphomannomutase
MTTYSKVLVDFVKKETGLDMPLEGFKVVVDAGNGAGGFYASKVLEPLGADISSSQFLEPDGNFPNHAPNPEDKKAMAAICDRVKECGTDLGLIFDTDVDRSSAVDEKGNEINRNSIVAWPLHSSPMPILVQLL